MKFEVPELKPRGQPLPRQHTGAHRAVTRSLVRIKTRMMIYEAPVPGLTDPSRAGSAFMSQRAIHSRLERHQTRTRRLPGCFSLCTGVGGAKSELENSEGTGVAPAAEAAMSQRPRSPPVTQRGSPATRRPAKPPVRVRRPLPESEQPARVSNGRAATRLCPWLHRTGAKRTEQLLLFSDGRQARWRLRRAAGGPGRAGARAAPWCMAPAAHQCRCVLVR